MEVFDLSVNVKPSGILTTGTPLIGTWMSDFNEEVMTVFHQFGLPVVIGVVLFQLGKSLWKKLKEPEFSFLEWLRLNVSELVSLFVLSLLPRLIEHLQAMIVGVPF